MSMQIYSGTNEHDGKLIHDSEAPRPKVSKSEIIHNFKMRLAGRALRQTGKIPSDIGNRKWRRKIESFNKK